jgi:flagellar protein FliO/FliZ
MQFITMVLGGPGNSVLTTILALGFVVVLIVLGLWVLKAGMRTTARLGGMRGRRLSIVEQLQIDPRRQLVIVRRDDTEHVLLIGGGQDVVVESNIPADTARKLPSAMPASERPPPTPTLATVGGAPATPAAAAPRAHMDRLRELTRPATIRNWRSLRHTGLLRPVSLAEASVIPMSPVAGDNAARPSADSATTARGNEDERALAASQDRPQERPPEQRSEHK